MVTFLRKWYDREGAPRGATPKEGSSVQQENEEMEENEEKEENEEMSQSSLSSSVFSVFSVFSQCRT